MYKVGDRVRLLSYYEANKLYKDAVPDMKEYFEQMHTISECLGTNANGQLRYRLKDVRYTWYHVWMLPAGGLRLRHVHIESRQPCLNKVRK